MNRSVILRVLESYFRHRWLHLAPIVIMLGFGAAYVINAPREYITEGLVNVPGESYLATLTAVRADQTGWWVTPAQNASNEITELLRTDTFMRSVIAMTDLADGLNSDTAAVQDLVERTRAGVWAVPQSDNQVLIGALHESPVVAYQLASALIENYTDWRIDTELAQSGVAQTFFADLITAYEAEVVAARQSLNEYLMAHPEPLSGDRPYLEQLELARLADVLARAQARLNAAQDSDESARLAALQTEVNVRQSFYVMDAPTIPMEPSTSKRKMAMQLGVFGGVGALLSAGAVVGGALLSRGFIFPVDVDATLHLPVLATIPKAQSPRTNRADQGLTIRVPANAYILSPIRSVPALPTGAIGPDSDVASLGKD